MTTTGGGPALHGAGAATPAGDGGPGVSVRRAPRLRTVLDLARVEAIAVAWYAPGTSKFLVKPPATALGVTLAWYAIASAALILTCAAMRDSWHRYSHAIHRSVVS